MRSLRQTAVVALVVGVVGLGTGVSSAQAADDGYVSSGSFGVDGSGDGEFVSPDRAAVHDQTGHVFVVDRGNNRVQVFQPNGSGSADYLTQFGVGVLNQPSGIAVDQADGDVYVLHDSGREIVRFDNDGAAPIPSFTVDPSFDSPDPGVGGGSLGTQAMAVAVDPATHEVVVAIRDAGKHRVARYTPTGDFNGSFDGAGSSYGRLKAPLDLAVDAGHVYVVDLSNGSNSQAEDGVVLRYTSAGSFDQVLRGVPAPARVAVDPDTGRVVVAGDQVPFGATGSRLYAYDGADLVTSYAYPGDNTGLVVGLALDGGGSGRLYAVGDRAFGFLGYLGVQVLEPAPLPEATLNIPTASSATEAHITGTVNPVGQQASWRVEISSDDGLTWNAPNGDRDAGDGTTDVAVEDDLFGLQPNTTYRARLAVTWPDGQVRYSKRVPFTTALDPPWLASPEAVDIGTTSARLRARLDPRNAVSRYWVEYGTDSSYGQRFPLTGGVTVEDGPPSVSLVVHGLTPGTAYRFRFVAVNAAGTTVGAEGRFTAHAPTTALPDGRVYEMVSPPRKNGYDVREVYTKTRSSANGNAVTYTSVGKFPDTDGLGAAQIPRYVAIRQSDRWITRGVDPPVEANHYGSLGGIVNDPQEAGNFSPDLMTSAVFGITRPLAPGADPGRVEFYRRATFAHPPYELISRSALPLPEIAGIDIFLAKPRLAAATPDMSHVLFETSANLLPGATGTARKAYEWHEGVVRLVGVLPDGTTAPDARAGTPAQGHPLTALNRETSQVMSEDGSRILFSTVSNGRLYLREGAGTPTDRTLWISESERSDPDPDPKPAMFRDATPTGDRVVFTSEEQLVDEDENSGVDLYAFDVDAPAGDRLTLLSADGEPTDGDGADVLGEMGMSRDGSRIYFAAAGQLVPGAPASPGTSKLYVWDGGELRYIATLEEALQEDVGTALNWTESQHQSTQRRVSRVSDDGRYLLYRSAHSEAPAAWWLYDIADRSATCVSCLPTQADGRSGVIPPDQNTIQTFQDRYLPRNLVQREGRALVFFHTYEALDGRDTNARLDVYRYDSRDGSVALVSSGRSHANSFFVDASPDGRDVFFVTREPLSRWDVDDQQDLYDARIGGGLPEPSLSVPCVDDACQGGSSGQLSQRRIGTLDAARTDGVSRSAELRVARLTRAQLSALALGRVARIKVRVTRPGIVRVRATAKIGGRGLVAFAGRARAARPGTVAVRLRLRPKARRALLARERLRLTLTSSLTGAAAARSTLVLRRPAQIDNTRKGR